MRTIKKAYAGTLTPSSSSVSSRMGSYGKKMKSGGTLAPTKKSVGKTIGKLNKAKSGTSLGMKSVKAGYDSNPGVTRADIIVAGQGKAKKGKMVKKAQKGITYSLPKPMKGTVSADTSGYSTGRKSFPATVTSPSGKTKSGNVPRRIIKSEIEKTSKQKMGGKTKKCAYGCK
jgi:hypothetical protein